MQDLKIIAQKTFEDIKIIDDEWFEFWSARGLMKTLWYKEWRKFAWVIDRAKVSCKNTWIESKNHFVSSDKMVWLWSWSKRKIVDYLLTRYACYLVAQNWDPRKIEVSLAQSYFANQTRKLEIAEQEIENNKRLETREKLRKSERQIEDTIYSRWIKLPVEFATFKNKWIQALYDTSIRVLKEKRWILKNKALADFDNEVELKAKDFVYAMTDHNIKEKNISWKQNLETELKENSRSTRKTLLERWIKPEELKPKEDLKLIEKRRKKQNKIKWKNIQKKINN